MSSIADSDRLIGSLYTLFRIPHRFYPQSMERQFIERYAATHLWSRRAGLLLGIVDWLVFIYWDYFVWQSYPQAMTEHVFWMVVAVRFSAVPILVVVALLAWSNYFLIEKIATSAIVVAGLYCCFSLIVMMALVPAPLNYQYYFVGVILVVFFIFGVSGILTGALLIFVAAVFMMLVAQQSFFETYKLFFFPTIFYYASFVMIGWVVGVKLERNARGEFVYILNLEEKNNRLEKANENISDERRKSDAVMSELFKKELLRVHDLKEKSEATSRFIRAAYHDTMQPLASISMLALVGEVAIKQQDIGKINEVLKDISQASQDIDHLFRGLRDVFMIGDAPVEIAPVFLQAIVEDICSTLLPRAQAKNLEIRLRHIQPELCISTDSGLLKRILVNVISNALKYTNNGGVVVAATARDGVAYIDIQDTGIGIKKELLGRIFDEFYQADNLGHDRQKGLGLGLFIVRTLIEKLPGHKIYVRSRVGKGSRFSLALPLSSMHTSASHSTLAGEPEFSMDGLAGSYIVIIDDDERVLRNVEGLFANLGCIVASAVSMNGLSALLKKTPDRSPDLVVTDYHLGGEYDAMDVIHRVRGMFNWAIVPVLIYSAELSQIDCSADLTEFIHKGEDPRLMLTKAQMLVEIGRAANVVESDPAIIPKT